MIICMDKLKMSEDVISYVDELRKSSEDRYMLDYMAAMSYLKMGQIDVALEEAVRLEEKVTKDENTREESNALQNKTYSKKKLAGLFMPKHVKSNF